MNLVQKLQSAHAHAHTHYHTDTHTDTLPHREANEYHTLGTLATACGGMHRLAKTTAKCEMSKRKQKCNRKSKSKRRRKISAKQNNKRRISKSNCNALLNGKQVGSTRQQLQAQQQQESFAKAWATHNRALALTHSLSHTLTCALSTARSTLSLSLCTLAEHKQVRAPVR